MLDRFEIAQLKEELGDIPLIYFQFEQIEYVFKQITPKEHFQARSLASTVEELEDAICQVCIVYPEHFRFAESCYPGHSKTISDEILKASYIDNDLAITDLFEEYRKRDNFIYRCQLMVKAAFQEIAFEEIEEWTWQKLVDMTARAEEILKLRGCNYAIEYDREALSNPPEEKEMHYVECARQGIDPMNLYAGKIIFEKPFIDLPVIAGASGWKDEEMFRDVQKYYVSKG